MSYVDRDLFTKMTELFDEVQEANTECEDLLINIWKETKDIRIEELFRKRGGCMIDGKFMFFKGE